MDVINLLPGCYLHPQGSFRFGERREVKPCLSLDVLLLGLASGLHLADGLES